ncbi:MAG: winged helix-turn-helix transcriptional regulator [Candidatus Thorarchaeota archaeon]|jgi:hypothetical protein
MQSRRRTALAAFALLLVLTGIAITVSSTTLKQAHPRGGFSEFTPHDQVISANGYRNESQGLTDAQASIDSRPSSVHESMTGVQQDRTIPDEIAIIQSSTLLNTWQSFNLDSAQIHKNPRETVSEKLKNGKPSSGTRSWFQRLSRLSTNDPFCVLTLGTVVIDRREEKVTSDLRTRIYRCVEENPGIHLREIQRHLRCAMGSLQYHVSQLEDEEIIKSVKIGKTKHFYMDDFSSDDRILKFAALNRNTYVNAILLECVSTQTITRAELSRVLEVDVSVVAYYVSQLLKANILCINPVFGREKPLAITDWAMESFHSFSSLQSFEAA